MFMHIKSPKNRKILALLGPGVLSLRGKSTAGEIACCCTE